MSKKLQNFLKGMLQVQPQFRSEVEELLHHTFIKESINDELSQHKIQETNLAVDGSNLLQFQMAFCLNQIAMKHTESQLKLHKVGSMREAMVEQGAEAYKKETTEKNLLPSF